MTACHKLHILPGFEVYTGSFMCVPASRTWFVCHAAFRLYCVVRSPKQSQDLVVAVTLSTKIGKRSVSICIDDFLNKRADRTVNKMKSR